MLKYIDIRNLMIIKDAQYIASYPSYSACPEGDVPEYAFVGRSNVGKSSLINYLLNRKNIARTSNKPGKTQMINYFLVNASWYMVDLPGFGYAKVSKKQRKSWELMVKNYLQHRLQLQNTFVLLDLNIKPQKIDLELINWMGEIQIPFSIVYTKMDKTRKRDIADRLLAYEEALQASWETLPPRFISSANKRVGGEDILAYIEQINERIKTNSKKS